MLNTFRRLPQSLRFTLPAAAVILLGYIAAYFATNSLESRNIFVNLFNNAVEIAAVGICALAAYRTRRLSKKIALTFCFLSVGQIFRLIPDIYWTLSAIYRNPTPIDATVNYFYAGFYILYFFAVISMPPRPSASAQKMKQAVLIAIAVVTLGLLYWNIFGGKIWERFLSHSWMFEGQLLSVPWMDVILLVAMMLLYRRINRNISLSAIISFLLGGLVMFFTDVVFSCLYLNNVYNNETWLCSGWTLASLFIASAGAHQLLSINNRVVNKKRNHYLKIFIEKINQVIVFIPFAILILAYALLIQNNVFKQFDLGILVYWIGCIIVLVIILQIITYYENRQLHQKLTLALEQVQEQAMRLSSTNAELRLEINDRKNAEDQLAYDALHDGLTGLPNRVLYNDRLDQALEFTQRHPESQSSVLFLDLDRFKLVNDSLGHNIGDQLLVQVSRRLTQGLRSIDTVARLGGDEFVFLLADTKEEKYVTLVTDRIMGELTPPFILDGHEIHITASIGVVMNIRGYTQSDQVIRDSDIAMYQAKSLGKARTAVFCPEMRNCALTQLELEDNLRYAIENKEFVLNYQPIIALDSSQLIGFEALIRWRHPQRGMIPPMEFIPAAEESGLIIPIGEWVLYEACAQIKKWQDMIPEWGGLKINVNISGRQYIQPDFVETVEQVLSTTGLKPEYLNLEITESILIENSKAANKVFTRLGCMGVRLEIDDFGTGYSSLGYLQNFPIHTIKIDKTFINNIGSGGGGSDMIRAMIMMASSLGIETIAEGVETEEQLKELQSLMCPFAQGYLLSRPMDNVAAEEYLYRTKVAEQI